MAAREIAPPTDFERAKRLKKMGRELDEEHTLSSGCHGLDTPWSDEEIRCYKEQQEERRKKKERQEKECADDVKNLKIGTTTIIYQVERHVTDDNGSLVDRGANSGVIGDDMRVV